MQQPIRKFQENHNKLEEPKEKKKIAENLILITRHDVNISDLISKTLVEKMLGETYDEEKGIQVQYIPELENKVRKFLELAHRCGCNPTKGDWQKWESEDVPIWWENKKTGEPEKKINKALIIKQVSSARD